MIEIYLFVKQYTPYLLSIAFVLVCAYIDAEHHRDNDFVESHTSRMVQRGIFGSMALLLGFKIMIFYLFSFWFLFDGVRNKLLSNNWYDLGSTSAIDKFFNAKPILYNTTKWISLSVCLYCVYLEVINK